MSAYNPDQFVHDNLGLAYSLARKYYMDDGGFCLDGSQQQWELNEIREEAHSLMGRLTERQKQIVRVR